MAKQKQNKTKVEAKNAQAEPKRKKISRKRVPNNYWEYVGLLAATLVLFATISLTIGDFPISMELRAMSLKNYTKTSVHDTVAQPNDTASADSAASSTPQPTPVFADSVEASVSVSPNTLEKTYFYNRPDTSSGEKILLIGDSMNENLRIRLNDYCIKNGHEMHCVIWYGSTTKQFGTCDTLAHFIRKTGATYVLLTLGANELFIRNIAEKRTGYVKHIIEQMGNLPFVWIGPPNWKDDTGINDLILQHVGAGRYFESKKLSFERKKDGAHLTKSSAFNWMNHIAEYLGNDALHPIAMTPPDTNYNKLPHTTILQMVRE